MALPATDNFDRGNGALGSNWTGSVGSDLEISSQEVLGSNGDCSMYWNADTPDDAQYAECELAAYGSGGGFGGPICRAGGSDWVLLDAASDASGWKIEWYNGGSWTQIGSTYGTAGQAGDIAKIEADGTGFEGFINTVSRISGSNGSAPSSGSGGLYCYTGVFHSLDDFEVGNLVEAGIDNLPSRRASNRGILRGVSRGIG